MCCDSVLSVGRVVCAAALSEWLLGVAVCGVRHHSLPAGSATLCAGQEPRHEALPSCSLLAFVLLLSYVLLIHMFQTPQCIVLTLV